MLKATKIFCVLLSKNFWKNKPCYSIELCSSLHASSRNYSSNSLNPLSFLQPNGEKLAIVDCNGSFTYSKLWLLSSHLHGLLKSQGILQGDRIAFLSPNDATHAICHWATWLNGSISVPLCPKHPVSEIEYILSNAQCKTIISSYQYAKVIKELKGKLDINSFILPDNFLSSTYQIEGSCSTEPVTQSHCNELMNLAGIIIYTSGTTGRPKGVLHTLHSLDAQIQNMIKAWKWKSDDVVLNVLPLHHIHGVVNLLICPLSVGACVVMENEFDPCSVWNHLLQKKQLCINVFMAVPTVYAKLIEYFDSNKMCPHETRQQCSHIRLMVSGSSALPKAVLKRWEEITGHVLLERYGMTEIGMGLTNSYEGTRVPGSVGLPFENISVKIARYDENGNVDANNYIVHAKGNNVLEVEGQGQGELLVKSSSMFKCYWNNSKATSESFVEGWFKTGDTAEYKDGTFRIVGRTSVDIIKSGGYKISALDIENHLINHPYVAEVVVVGVSDPIWGQRVAALIKLASDQHLTLDELRDWCRERMPVYQIPSAVKFVNEIPRNVMGKVNKKDLVSQFFTVQ